MSAMPVVHMITSEYPPQPGGVSDYTRQIARELAAAGDSVHIWCPACEAPAEPPDAGVTVHREFGRFEPSGLCRVGRQLNGFTARRLLVQWVPHGYGFQAMNVFFCLWLWKRAAMSGDRVEIMVHEPFLAFGEGSWKQDLAAIAHRLMTLILLQAADKVWTVIPAWEKCWRPYTLGRRVPFQWIPAPSNVPPSGDRDGAGVIRARFQGAVLIGQFGTYSRAIQSALLEIVPRLLDGAPERVMLFMGRGSEAFQGELLRLHPRLVGQVHASGPLETDDLSRSIAACDLLLQPYPDGTSTRRTSLMAGLEHGIPTVSTSGRLTEPFWGDSGVLALVPAGDTEAFVQAAQRLLDNEPERKRMGAAARALYKSRFDVKHVVTALRAA